MHTAASAKGRGGDVHRLVQGLDVIRYTLQIGPMSIWQEEDFIKRMLRSRARSAGHRGRRPSGRMDRRRRHHWRNGNGESGIVIGEKSVWRRGVATEAMALRTRYCFHELNLHKIRTRAYMENEASSARS